MSEPFGPLVLHGDCVKVMATMPDNCVDAIVTDPPYDLTSGKKDGTGGGFMGKHWDATGIAFDPNTWRKCLRVLKPGGHLLSFGGTRTSHRMACAVEDAGFEIRDSIAWLTGSGFPKGKSQMKPAHEPIIMARKPFDGTVTTNVLTWGTGALNIDATRIGTDKITAHGGGINGAGRTYGMGAGIPAIEAGSNPHVGRWPANVVLDESMAAVLDEQTGVLTSGKMKAGTARANTSGWAGPMPQETGSETRGDTGGASRFFYVAKASAKERPKVDGISHPTVKPLALMRWLVRLVTPPGGTVLDPFAGSGTTLEAAILEGFGCIGIEAEADYLPLIQARLDRSMP